MSKSRLLPLVEALVSVGDWLDVGTTIVLVGEGAMDSWLAGIGVIAGVVALEEMLSCCVVDLLLLTEAVSSLAVGVDDCRICLCCCLLLLVTLELLFLELPMVAIVVLV